MAENNDIIFTLNTPGKTGDIVGIIYDEARQCWRVDYPCRINGKATHLKDTVHGPKTRKMQMEAMRRLLELQDRVKKPDSSLKFRDAVEQYIKQNPRLADNILRIITYLNDSLGKVKMHEFKTAFVKWIRAEEKRNVMRWRRVSGKLKLCDTGKPISRSTIQSYMRYVKLIVRLSGHNDIFEGITIGRRVVRRRALEPYEMLRLEESCRNLYPWFYAAFDFARCNPIRPEDQFRLTVEDDVKGGGRIIYAPQKTYPKTGLMAYPIRWEHQAGWYDGLVTGLLFPRPDGSSMLGKGKYYQYVWDRIRTAAGLPDVQFYDLRHHAVAWMRSCGISDWRIAKAAGWGSTQMITDYDPDNRHLIEQYDKAQESVVNCSTACSTATNLDVGFVK